MKDLILDDPTKYSFPDFLENGESILWQGKPSYSNIHHSTSDKKQPGDYSQQTIWGMLIIMFVLFYLFDGFNWLSFLFAFGYLAVAIFFSWLRPAWNHIFKSNYKYAITQNQILFQVKEKWWHLNSSFYSIPFSEIKDIIIVMRYDMNKVRKEKLTGNSQFSIQDYKDKGLDKIGSIILVPHHPDLISFETKNLTNHTKRDQPSLELLEDVEKISKIIQEGIQTKLK